MKKPGTLKWAQGLSILQIIVDIAVIALLIWLVDAAPTNAFLIGVKQGFSEGMAESGIVYDYETAGYLSAIPLFGMVASILTLVAIKFHTKKWGYTAMILMGLHFLGAIVNGGRALLSIIIFVLLLTKSAKTYFGISEGVLTKEKKTS